MAYSHVIYNFQQILLDKILINFMKLAILEKRPSEKIWHVKRVIFFQKDYSSITHI